MIYIIIPVFNRIELTRNCLNSLEKQTGKNFKIMVVNDGSTDGTSEMLKKDFPGVNEIHGDGNLWWTGAINSGLKYILSICNKEDYVLTLNNDTLLPVQYIESLTENISKYPLSLIGSVALDNNNPDTIIEAGININWLTAKYYYNNKNEKYSSITKENYNSCEMLSGRGTAIPVTAFKEIGIYDKKNFPHYAADYEFSIRAKKNGFSLIVPNDLFLISFPKLSGIGNSDLKISIRDFLKSFQSIRSGNNLKIRFRFAQKVLPFYKAPVFFFFDTLRVMVSSLKKIELVN